MEPERWQKIEHLCYSALNEEKSARAAFLEQACGGDDALRRAVELLLAQHEKDDHFLESPAMEVAAKHLAHQADAVFSDPLAEADPDTSGLDATYPSANTAAELTSVEQKSLGPYRLLQKLGEGGMGRVWLAEQTAPVRRRVAVKLIKAGMYDDAVLKRFASERQSLAIMDHPSIAKVFDAGTTPDGQPYFVMEYVPGVPITDYCDQKRLNIRERMGLFIKVCDGVQHAHTKAIIHRDLKPANILVTEVDGKPLPRIIDFGLAKATARQTPDESMLTRLGSFVGTPGYMSPEQADTSLQDVDTRTDVYSLGVVLYVLLTGSLPFDSKKNVHEVLRQVREDEPPRPSTKIATGKKSSTGSAQNRGSEPRQLSKLLRGDLDWITMKALEKDRTRRYGTPSEMAADIIRYLHHEPVVARPASTAYRMRKYARRHRAALIGVSAFALLLIVAAVVSVLQSIRASRETAVAKAVNDFLQQDVLAQASGDNQLQANFKPDPNITVRTLLDHAAQRMDGRFANQPETEVTLRNTFGTIYTELGAYPEARQQLERALALGLRTLGADDPKTLTAESSLGELALIQARYTEAQMLNRQALEGRRRVLGPENPATLKSMSRLGEAYDHDRKYVQAEALYSQALETQRRVLGPESPDTLLSMNNLTAVYTDEGKYTQAESLGLQTLEIMKRVLGPERTGTLTLLGNLGILYTEEGKYAQAEVTFSQLLEIERRVNGPGSPGAASAKYNWACLEARQGNKDKAMALLSDAVDHGLPPYFASGMGRDAGLTSLHDDPRFIAMVADVKKRAAATKTLE